MFVGGRDDVVPANALFCVSTADSGRRSVAQRRPLALGSRQEACQRSPVAGRHDPPVIR